MEENEKRESRSPQKEYYQASKERGINGVEIPNFWRKKKLKMSFVRKLKETADKATLITDDSGSYKDGLFLYSCAIVLVTINKNGLWSVTIHSDYPIGLPLIKEIRYKYVPNSFLMAMLFPSKEELSKEMNVKLFQIPNQEGGKDE